MDTLWLSNCAGTHPRYSFLYPHPFLNAVACQKKNKKKAKHVLLQSLNLKVLIVYILHLCLFVLVFFFSFNMLTFLRHVWERRRFVEVSGRHIIFSKNAEMHKQPAWYACADSQSRVIFPSGVFRLLPMASWRDAVRLFSLIDLRICKKKFHFCTGTRNVKQVCDQTTGSVFARS